jgi:hypothetical protein
VHDEFAVKVHLPVTGLLQGVDAADEGTLARTRRTDDSNLFPLPNMQINIFEGLHGPKELAHPLQPDHPVLLCHREAINPAFPIISCSLCIIIRKNVKLFNNSGELWKKRINIYISKPFPPMRINA